jgi:hypothetical protein
MRAELKAEVQEIVEVVKTVPQELQARAFDLLLQDAIERHSGRKVQSRRENGGEEDEKKPSATPGRHPRPSGDIDPDALPMRVKAFMKRTKVTAPQIAALFHIEADQFEPIWTIKGAKVSKAQVQVALLQSLHRALTSGEFSFDREEVRTECENKKTYDKTNFKANFRNNGKLFSGLEKEGLVGLTDEGMTALANLIVELAGSDNGE